ncbi:MAG: RNA polymerase sigma factor [Alphaproteobacteria bacterium]|nr:RNA polymerase sigma factor [Alphaproteobacteria bacterium]
MHRIEAYLGRLYRYAFSLAREDDLARDLVQRCALKALGAKTVPDDESAYRAWLFVILRNDFRDHLRRHRLTLALFDDEPDAEPEDAPTMEYWRGDERLINVLNVKQALGRLRPRDQEIVSLIDMVGLSYAEAAKVLDVPEGTVMSRISRARARLLALVGESNVEPLTGRRGPTGNKWTR